MVILRELIRRSRCLLSAALTNSDNTLVITIALSHITLLTEYLVEYFVQSWYKGDLSIHDGLFFLIPYPHGLGGLLHRSHVKVWTQQNVFQLGLALVHLLDGYWLFAARPLNHRRSSSSQEEEKAVVESVASINH